MKIIKHDNKRLVVDFPDECICDLFDVVAYINGFKNRNEDTGEVIYPFLQELETALHYAVKSAAIGRNDDGENTCSVKVLAYTSGSLIVEFPAKCFNDLYDVVADFNCFNNHDKIGGTVVYPFMHEFENVLHASEAAKKGGGR